MRTLLYEAAQVLLTRVKKWSWVNAWAMNVAKRGGLRKAIVALARRLAVIMHRMWSDGTEFRWTRDEATACGSSDEEVHTRLRSHQKIHPPVERCPSRDEE